MESVEKWHGVAVQAIHNVIKSIVSYSVDSNNTASDESVGICQYVEIVRFMGQFLLINLTNGF